MKTLKRIFNRIFRFNNEEIKEAPRFEEWFNEMFPKDNMIPGADDFFNTIKDFQIEKKRSHAIEYDNLKNK